MDVILLGQVMFESKLVGGGIYLPEIIDAIIGWIVPVWADGSRYAYHYNEPDCQN